ncbi:hypothetical protein FHU10_3374 [Serratia fonticola]|uniref:Uncharacterized protein n=1 Tax=Serratia fonticola TaxID=47917 RepID=A0A542CZN2_SERFO|nr:hypothetical protein [Serratia fonticola]TQI81694.1 hypothetical protein FHU09_4335 [Serratia fonticola]TQI96282.1 hypothetical protein FHU11_1713 [Serratia fonticola]TVZ70780.1 hypothetical protein FHU10_3374 [Serratia fonticola]
MARSVDAGVACTTCDNPDPCIHEVTLDFDKQHQVWPVKPMLSMDLLDKGKGATGSINITTKCNKAASHSAVLESDKFSKRIGLNNPEAITLFYKEQNQSLVATMPSIWSYLSNIANPNDLFSDGKRYDLIVNCCEGRYNYATIRVYPSVEFTYSVAFTYAFSHNERTIKERRDEQIKARKAMENVKPKNGNQLRSGWETRTDKFSLTQTTALEFTYGLKVQGVDYSAKYADKCKENTTAKTLDAVSRIDKLLSSSQKYLLPAPKSTGVQNYTIAELKVEPMNVGIAYAYSRLDTVASSTHFIGFNAAPFLDLTGKLDLIQLAAAYCKIDALADKCRQAIRRKNAGDKNYLEIECYILLKCSLSFRFGAALKQEIWTFDAGKNNDLKFSLEGKVNAAFKTKVMILEIALNAGGKVKTAAGFKLDQHDDGIDLVGYHDGIVAEVEFSADASWKDEDIKYQEDSTRYSVKKKNKWEIAAPLKESESALRVNLIGKERPIVRPKVIPGEPWAMGSNPKWDTSPKPTNEPWAMGTNPQWNK